MDSPAASADLARFGARLRALRAERGISQEQLAHEAGLHRAVVGFIERGERDFGISKLWPLASALDVSVRDFFD
jgi:transcriptional regulator with XRE-family HTH domain